MGDLFVFQGFQLDVLRHDLGSSTFAPLNSSTVGLYHLPITIDESTTLDALNADSATFNGYAPKSINWAVPSLSEADKPQSIGTVQAWRPTDDSIDDSEVGVYVYNDNGLCFAGPIPGGPVPMGSNLNTLVITLRYFADTSADVQAIW